MPGMTAGTCLRKDFAFSEERSHAPGMLLAVSRVNEGVPLFLVEGIKRRIGSSPRARSRCSGLTFKRDTDDERDSLSPKLIRLLERELADVAVCDPHAGDPDPAAGRGGPRRRRGDRRHQPLRVRASRDAARDPRARRRRLPAGRSVGRARHRAGVRVRRRDAALLGARRASTPRRTPPTDGPGAGHGRCRHDRRRPSCGACCATLSSRCGSPITARRRAWMREGCEIHTGDLRDLDVGARGARRLLARDPPGRDRRRDRELPQAPVHAHRGQQRAHRRDRPRRGRPGRGAASCTCPPRWCSSAPPSSRPPRTTSTRARRRARPTGSPSSAGEVYARAAHDQHGLRLHDLPPVQRLRPGRAARPRRAGDRPRRPRPDRQGAGRAAPAADLRLRRADAHAHPRRRHRRRDRHRDGLARRRERGLQHLGLRGADRRRDRRADLGGLRRGSRRVRAFEHLPSFEVDVQRRWPSVEKARRLLGWESRIDLRDGLAATVAWLREQSAQASAP